MKKNNKGFTLLEMIIYMGVFLIASIFIITTFNWGIKQNEKINLNIQENNNLNGSYLHLKKLLENVNNVLLIEHKNINSEIPGDTNNILIDNKYFNQFQFSLNHLKNECGFITNDDFDLVAFSSTNDLDPIVLGIIQRTTESGRPYYQLAMYKYYSILTEKSKILNDVLSVGNGINNFVDNRGLYKTDGLNNYKCDIKNGHLIPISSKFYLDENYDYTYTSFLKKFKIITTDVNDNIKYGNGYVQLSLTWESRDNLTGRIKYQVFSKELGKTGK